MRKFIFSADSKNLNNKDTSLAPEIVNLDETSLKSDQSMIVNQKIFKNDVINGRKVVKYSNVFKITMMNINFKDAVEIFDRKWGYLNSKRIWIEVPGKTDHFYIYGLKIGHYRRLSCSKCEKKKRYSKAEIIKENGKERLFELCNHDEKCEYNSKKLNTSKLLSDSLVNHYLLKFKNNQNQSTSKPVKKNSEKNLRQIRSKSMAPEMFGNELNFESSMISVKFEKSKVSKMMTETPTRFNMRHVRSKSLAPEDFNSTGPVLRKRQSEGLKVILPIKQDLSAGRIISTNRWILPCDKNGVSNGKLFIVSKQD